MKRRKSESLAPDKAPEKRKRNITKKKSDFSDLPELSDEQLNIMSRVGRPPFGESARRLIAIRIDQKVLNSIRKIAEQSGQGYQTLINEILAQYVNRRSA